MSPDPYRRHRFAGLEIDTARRVLERDGKLVDLPRKSCEILLLLLAEPGRLVTKEMLFQKVWPDVLVEENNLAQAVSALRRAIGDAKGAPRWIETVARHGYRFIGVPEEEAVAETRPSPEASRSEFEPRLPVLAVLPFRMLAGSADGTYLGIGLADALIARLSGFSGLRPRSTGAVRRFAETDFDPIDAGRELKADLVLDGHLRVVGDRLSVSAQLLSVESGDVLWAERLGERLDDFLAVEDRIAERIAYTLALRWRSDRPPWRRGTADPEAYRLYLRGRYAANRLTSKGYRDALAALAESTRRDPSFALAHEGVAYADLMALELFVSPAEAIPRARSAASRALALDPGLAVARAALAGVAFWHDRDRPAAERELDAAFALDPGCPSTLRLAAWFATLDGRFAEGFALLARAAEADPYDLEHHLYELSCSHFARRYERAIEAARRARGVDPDFWLAEVLVGRCHEALGDIDLALERFEAARRAEPDVAEIAADVGRALGLAGRRSEAEAVLAELETPGRYPHVAACHRALVHLGLGHRDRCLEELARSLEERSWYVSWFRTAPVLDPLRDDPRFAELRRLSGM